VLGASACATVSTGGRPDPGRSKRQGLRAAVHIWQCTSAVHITKAAGSTSILGRSRASGEHAGIRYWLVRKSAPATSTSLVPADINRPCSSAQRARHQGSWDQQHTCAQQSQPEQYRTQALQETESAPAATIHLVAASSDLTELQESASALAATTGSLRQTAKSLCSSAHHQGSSVRQHVCARQSVRGLRRTHTREALAGANVSCSNKHPCSTSQVAAQQRVSANIISTATKEYKAWASLLCRVISRKLDCTGPN
jgi:hypothetical protein